MKKIFNIVAMTMIMAMIAGVSMAENVDIGLGSMDRTEFETLKQMVRGDFQQSASVFTERPKETHVAEFNQSDVDSIRLAMTTKTTAQDATASVPKNGMVDIGTGSMTSGEFCSLNKMVAMNHNSGFAFICL